MTIDDDLKSVLLLCTYFSSGEVKDYKPLQPLEYGRFATWMKDNSYVPSDLFYRMDEVFQKWNDPKGKIDISRVSHLFERGRSLGISLEKWQRSGIWILSRSSPEYPAKLKERLKSNSPAILFGVGNKKLLQKKGVGFVGSRKINNEDETFTKDKVELAVSEGFQIISGGAKGIDQTSMFSALECGGQVVGVVSDSLLKSSLSRKYREYLRSDNLVLISSFYPDAGFSPGNAMARNKYIYCLSDCVVVVKSDYKKGGTWSGATENMKKDWVPLLVRDIPQEGNQELINLGATEFNSQVTSFNIEFKKKPLRSFNEPPQKSLHKTEKIVDHNETEEPDFLSDFGPLLRLFYNDILEHCKLEEKVTLQDLEVKYPELTKANINKWIKVLVDNKVLLKDGRRSVYSLASSGQPDLFS